MELPWFPGVGEGPSVNFGVGQHLLKLGAIEGAVDEGVDLTARRRRRQLAQWGKMGKGTRWGWGGVIAEREAGWAVDSAPGSL